MNKIKRTLTLFILLLLSVSCTNSSNVDLQNGYQICFMSATEVYIGNKQGVLVVGPTVTGLFAKDDYIVGLVKKSRKDNNNPDVKPGYFIVNTKNETVTTGLTLQAWIDELNKNKIKSLPELRPPTTNFKISD